MPFPTEFAEVSFLNTDQKLREGSNNLGCAWGFPCTQFPNRERFFSVLCKWCRISVPISPTRLTLPRGNRKVCGGQHGGQDPWWRQDKELEVQAESRRALKEDGQNSTSIEITASRGSRQECSEVCLSCNETSRGRAQWPHGRKSARLSSVPFQSMITYVVHSLLVYLV